MHDIWNPWHGCTKCSEGCQNCYMYYLDRTRGNMDSSTCVRTAGFSYPLQKDRHGNYKIKSGLQYQGRPMHVLQYIGNILYKKGLLF